MAKTVAVAVVGGEKGGCGDGCGVAGVGAAKVAAKKILVVEGERRGRN